MGKNKKNKRTAPREVPLDSSHMTPKDKSSSEPTDTSASVEEQLESLKASMDRKVRYVHRCYLLVMVTAIST